MDDFSYNPIASDGDERPVAMRSPLLPEGEYKATVVSYDGHLAASGNRNVIFTYEIIDAARNQYIVTDYIPLTDSMAWKLRKHCKAARLEKEYLEKLWHPRLSLR